MGKITSSFVSLNGKKYSVEISNANITQDKVVFLAPDAIHLIVANNELKYQGLRSTECQINIISKEDLMELYTEDILGTTVIVRRIIGDNSKILFAGFLEPSQWNQPAIPGDWNEMQVVAIDAWSAMKQYPMYIRTAAAFSWWIVKMRSFINEAFANTGVDIAAFVDTPDFDDSFIVNNDALMPSDLYAEEGFDKFPSYGDILKEVGMAINRSFIMIGTNLEMYNVDAVNEFWTEHAENHLQNSNVSVEIVPSKRSVFFKADYPPQQDEPAVKERYERYIAGGIVNGWDGYKDQYVYFYEVPSDYGLYWENYLPIPGNRQCIMGVNYADDQKSLSWDKDSLFLGVSAVSSPIHPRLCNMPKGYFDFKIEADIFINPDYDEEDKWRIVPQLWNVGRPEAAGESGNFNSSTIALLVDGQLVDPIAVTTDYDSEKAGWQHCTFRFQTPDYGVELRSGNVKIVLRSPSLSSNRGYRYARNVKYIMNEEVYTLEKRLPCNGKNTGDDLELDCTINTLAQETGSKANNGTIQGSTPGLTIAGTMASIAQQYSRPRRQWSLTISDNGYDPRHKVIYNNITCTQMGSDWDLRNDIVTAKILESK